LFRLGALRLKRTHRVRRRCVDHPPILVLNLLAVQRRADGADIAVLLGIKGEAILLKELSFPLVVDGQIGRDKGGNVGLFARFACPPRHIRRQHPVVAMPLPALRQNQRRQTLDQFERESRTDTIPQQTFEPGIVPRAGLKYPVGHYAVEMHMLIEL